MEMSGNHPPLIMVQAEGLESGVRQCLEPGVCWMMGVSCQPGVNGCQAVTGVSQVTAVGVRCWLDTFQHELLGSVNYILFLKLNYITVLV